MSESTIVHSAAEPTMESLCRLIQSARVNGSDFASLLELHMPSLKYDAEMVPKEEATIMAGTMPMPSIVAEGSSAVWGKDFLFVFKSELPGCISIDDDIRLPMKCVDNTKYWFLLTQLRLDTTHNYTLYSGERAVGASSVAGYNPESYPIPQAPKGQYVGKGVITSNVYKGAESDYWIYVNEGVDKGKEAPLMLYLDGQRIVGQRDVLNFRAPCVVDNLAYLGKIPPMIHLFLGQARGGPPMIPERELRGQDAAIRSYQYDTLTDDFNRYLEDEVIPEVEKIVKVRKDGYSRGITGESSGGACAFRTSWLRPNQFSRVLSTIGSFTALQWKPHVLDGSNILPFMVRREPKKNIRMWLSDGMNDFEVESTDAFRSYVNDAGSWPVANISMAIALKSKGYDFHFRYGDAYHNSAQASLDLPEALTWLWRGYDSTKDQEDYEQDEAERKQPMFQVGITNRTVW